MVASKGKTEGFQCQKIGFGFVDSKVRKTQKGAADAHRIYDLTRHRPSDN